MVGYAIQARDQINTASNKIAEIAFQTNLLAPNASGEVARPGEQGRGYVVVATEVRNLASRPATAVKQIKELTRDSVEKVKAGLAGTNSAVPGISTVKKDLPGRRTRGRSAAGGDRRR